MDKNIESLGNVKRKFQEIIEDTNYIQTTISANNFTIFDVYKKLNNIKDNVNIIQNIYDEIDTNINE